MAYSHLFNGEYITKFYVQHRPSYPSFISEVIMKYIHKQKDNNSENGRLKKMLDVGCGAGQSTHMFASYFESILGIDVSDSQIKHAKEHNPNKNVEFRLVRDNFFPVEDESVDLVTCAMAIHWLDLTTFETECYRVLKPRGCCLALDEEKAPMCELGNSVKRILEMEDIPDQDIKFILTYTYPTMAFTKSTAPAVSQDSG
ncbi:putative methyltransferase DDB_G0268948 [Styela clava]